MANIVFATQRPDVDIEGEIEHLIAHYPPLQNDRRQIQVRASDGKVTISGHVQTPNTRRYFLDHLRGIAGITEVSAADFYDDQTVRNEVGRVLPEGVRVARVQYGMVVLTGTLPVGMKPDDVTARVRSVPGVEMVITDFSET